MPWAFEKPSWILVIDPGGEKPHAGNGTPMLGNQTQLPWITGAVHVIPHAAGARLTFAQESANAVAGIANAATPAAAATNIFSFIRASPEVAHSLRHRQPEQLPTSRPAARQQSARLLTGVIAMPTCLTNIITTIGDERRRQT